jgi:type IV pilus assembly protein PilB
MFLFNRVFGLMNVGKLAKHSGPFVPRFDGSNLSGTAADCAREVLRRYRTGPSERQTEAHRVDDTSVDEMLRDFTDTSIDFDISLSHAGRIDVVDLLQMADLKPPTQKLVVMVLLMAIRDGASDIHFEPFEDEYKMRYRCDGVLMEMVPPPRHLGTEIAAYIKQLANLDVAETSRHQAGRISATLGGNRIDLWASILPSRFGESVVVRIPDLSGMTLDMLGMAPTVLAEYRRLIHQRRGLMIHTGCAGQGKSTTMYAALNELNRSERKIVTIEDPVENYLQGITQVAVDREVGLDFSPALRAALHHAPDVILVGQIRDLETTELAVSAALANHLVFSPLHSNDAAHVVARLRDVGIPYHLIAAGVIGIMSHRLVRKVCPACRVEYQPPADQLRQLGLAPEHLAGRPLYYGTGCDQCNHTGYLGRTGLFELISVDNDLRDLIYAGASTEQLRQHVRQKGVPSLRQAGLDALFAGVTTIDDVLRSTNQEDC